MGKKDQPKDANGKPIPGFLKMKKQMYERAVGCQGHHLINKMKAGELPNRLINSTSITPLEGECANINDKRRGKAKKFAMRTFKNLKKSGKWKNWLVASPCKHSICLQQGMEPSRLKKLEILRILPDEVKCPAIAPGFEFKWLNPFSAPECPNDLSRLVPFSLFEGARETVLSSPTLDDLTGGFIPVGFSGSVNKLFVLIPDLGSRDWMAMPDSDKDTFQDLTATTGNLYLKVDWKPAQGQDMKKRIQKALGNIEILGLATAKMIFKYAAYLKGLEPARSWQDIMNNVQIIGDGVGSNIGIAAAKSITKIVKVYDHIIQKGENPSTTFNFSEDALKAAQKAAQDLPAVKINRLTALNLLKIPLYDESKVMNPSMLANNVEVVVTLPPNEKMAFFGLPGAVNYFAPTTNGAQPACAGLDETNLKMCNLGMAKKYYFSGLVAQKASQAPCLEGFVCNIEDVKQGQCIVGGQGLVEFGAHVSQAGVAGTNYYLPVSHVADRYCPL